MIKGKQKENKNYNTNTVVVCFVYSTWYDVSFDFLILCFYLRMQGRFLAKYCFYFILNDKIVNKGNQNETSGYLIFIETIYPH